MSKIHPMSPANTGKSYWFTLARVVLFWVASIIAFASATRYLGRGSGLFSSIWAVLGAIAATLLLTLLFARRQKTGLGETGIIPGRNSLPRLLFGLLAGCLSGAMQTIPVLLTGHIRVVVNNSIGADAIITTILLYFLLACREELAFHGYALQRLKATGGPGLALLFTTLLFIIEHIMGGMSWQAATWGSGTGSLLFGIAALKSKGLALPIGLHAGWNAMQWTLGFKDNQAPFRSVVDIGFENKLEVIGTISYLVIMGLAIGILLYHSKKKSSQNR